MAGSAARAYALARREVDLEMSLREIRRRHAAGPVEAGDQLRAEKVIRADLDYVKAERIKAEGGEE